MDSTVSNQQEPSKNTLRWIILIGVIIALLVIGVSYFIVHSRAQDAHRSTRSTTSQPTYSTVLPHDSSIKALGGWQRLEAPNGGVVFVYADEISHVPISVSQQPLPQSFINDVDSNIEKLAKSYNATDTIDAKGAKVYIGTSAKGPQSVIFTKDKLLILIKSQDNISDKAWKKYITSLE